MESVLARLPQPTRGRAGGGGALPSHTVPPSIPADDPARGPTATGISSWEKKVQISGFLRPCVSWLWVATWPACL